MGDLQPRNDRNTSSLGFSKSGQHASAYPILEPCQYPWNSTLTSMLNTQRLLVSILCNDNDKIILKICKISWLPILKFCDFFLHHSLICVCWSSALNLKRITLHPTTMTIAKAKQNENDHESWWWFIEWTMVNVTWFNDNDNWQW